MFEGFSLFPYTAWYITRDYSYYVSFMNNLWYYYSATKIYSVDSVLYATIAINTLYTNPLNCIPG